MAKDNRELKESVHDTQDELQRTKAELDETRITLSVRQQSVEDQLEVWTEAQQVKQFFV